MKSSETKPWTETFQDERRILSYKAYAGCYTLLLRIRALRKNNTNNTIYSAKHVLKDGSGGMTTEKTASDIRKLLPEVPGADDPKNEDFS